MKSVRQSAGEIETEAARWVMRLDREGRTSALEAELEQWLAGDVRRRGAFLQAEAAWLRLDRAHLLGPQAVPARRLRSRGLPRRALFAGLGALAAASVAAVVLLNLPETYATGVGEVRRAPLADGSTVALNTDSRLDVTLRPEERRIRLGRGEAWFQVAKDADRPFVVEAGLVRAEAVGTAFSVRRREGGADILVTEGVVRAWAVGSEGRAIELRAGAKAFVSDRAEVAMQVENAPGIDRELAWRSGRIDLEGETLGYAAREFNRYNSRKLVISPELRDERLYGVFRIDDPEGFARTVGTSLDAKVQVGEAEIAVGPS